MAALARADTAPRGRRRGGVRGIAIRLSGCARDPVQRGRRPRVTSCLPGSGASPRSRAWRSCSRSSPRLPARERPVTCARSAASAPGSTSTTTCPAFQGDGGPPPVTRREHRRHGRARSADAVPPGRPGRRPDHGCHRRPAAPRATSCAARTTSVSRSSPGTYPSSTTFRRDLRRIRGVVATSRAGASASTGSRSIPSTTAAVPDPEDAQPRARRRRAERARELGRVAAARSHRARATAHRPGQHAVLARLPVAEAAELLRRVDADELLDEPRPSSGLPRRIRLHGREHPAPPAPISATTCRGAPGRRDR